MQGQVYKIHSDFYYVKNFEHKEFECKLKDVLKKQKIDIKVGDFVELSADNSYISSLLTRKNTIERPKVSNIDLALVVCSLKEPDLDYIQLNRYLTYLKYYNIDCAICFNKEDLELDFYNKKQEINAIYKNLNYKTFFVSAKNKLHLETLREFIKSKSIVFLGASGAGKSTLLSALTNKNLKTGEVSTKTKRGTHTTRHCEIIEFDDFKLIDTPGFQRLKFDFLLPNQLINLFDDIRIYSNDCKYSNCLHNSENNCAVLKNLDKIVESRYQSYLCFLEETLEYKEQISKKSIKKEDYKKDINDKVFTKISKRKRELSRNTLKQKTKDNKS